jgi:glycosyltransferase involved in cell wall biosynthesis
MKQLPIHFFTIVLNGDPFIRYHIEMFRSLNVPWHWHIVEGVAELKHDTGWSLENGGKIPSTLHRNGLSIDGTTEYLNQLAAEYPENISIYRKPSGQFWEGKREMVNAPLNSIKTEALLIQLDNDELWTKQQIETLHRMFEENPSKTAAHFWCWYFVGPELVVSSRNCYAQNPNYEWQRAWRYTPGSSWVAHEPPILQNNRGQDIARLNPFTHFETEKQGLVFQHFSYVTKEQLIFKEQYYGYKNALSKWELLQSNRDYPTLLRNYFPWVKDSTIVEPISRFAIEPLATLINGSWNFKLPKNPNHSLNATRQITQISVTSSVTSQLPKIVIDGVYFAKEHRGIARVWSTLLEEWAKTPQGERIVLLDRNNTAPKIPGIRTRVIPEYNPANFLNDKKMLEQVCREENADIFCSTYYTTPEQTKSILLVHDMIPEVLGWDLSHSDWQDKKRAIEHASFYFCGSENSRKDLLKIYPKIDPKLTTVILNGFDKNTFNPASAKEILNFHSKYQIDKPYFLMVGPRLDYKNGQLLFDALAKLPAQHGYGVFCTGQDRDIVRYGQARSGAQIYSHRISNQELAAAYSGAVALIFPSIYEGFGLPLVEAMACRCPVIAYPNGASMEIAKDGAIFAADAEQLCEALCEIQKPKVRKALIEKGMAQANTFSWTRSAQKCLDAFKKFNEKQQATRIVEISSGIMPFKNKGLEISNLF